MCPILSFVGSLYLTTQNLKGNKIYRDLHFCTFRSVKNCKSGDFDRFCYRLGSEWLNKGMPRMTKLDTPTIGPSMFTLTSCRLHSSFHSKVNTVWLKYQTLKISIIAHLYITLFMIYKLGKLTYRTTLVIIFIIFLKLFPHVSKTSTFTVKSIILQKMVWEVFAEKNKVYYGDMSVIFRNVRFHKSVEIPQNGSCL